MFLLIFSFVSLTAPFASSPVAYSPFVNSPFATSPFKSLYMFKGAPDGQAPEAGLVELKGALYGTTYEGGTNNLGTVFEIDKRGQEHVLYSFQGGTDGAQPAVGLIALTCLGLVGSYVFNINDDDPAYVYLADRLLHTGGLIDPFNQRRIMELRHEPERALL